MSDKLNDPNSLINKIASGVHSSMESKHMYDVAKEFHDLYSLMYDGSNEFPSYEDDDLLRSFVKGYMRNWRLKNEKTGVEFQPLIDDYIGDTPIDFGIRITKDIK
jgi:hypothetical protein